MIPASSLQNVQRSNLQVSKPCHCACHLGEWLRAEPCSARSGQHTKGMAGVEGNEAQPPFRVDFVTGEARPCSQDQGYYLRHCGEQSHQRWQRRRGVPLPSSHPADCWPAPADGRQNKNPGLRVSMSCTLQFKFSLDHILLCGQSQESLTEESCRGLRAVGSLRANLRAHMELSTIAPEGRSRIVCIMSRDSAHRLAVRQVHQRTAASATPARRAAAVVGGGRSA